MMKMPPDGFGPSLERALAAADEGQPQLTYAMSPDYGTVSQTNAMTLIVTNPSDLFDVSVFAGADVLSVRDWTALTQVPAQITPDPPASTPWQAAMTEGASGTYLKIWVLEDVTIGPKKSVQFAISNILFDDTVARVTLSVVEFLDSKRATPPPIMIGKLGREMQIFAHADPAFVAKGQSANIVWTIVGGEWVIVQPPEDSDKYPRQGTGPWTFSTPRKPDQIDHQTRFNARVFETGGKEKNEEVTVTVSSPVITRFDPANLPAIALRQPVELQWQTRYATRVLLAPVGAQLEREGRRTLEPGKYLPTNVSEVQFTIRAEGFRTPAETKITFRFLPLRVNWFRYATFAKDAFIISLGNDQMHQIAPIAGKPNAWRLTANGPGGPLTQELGGDGLEIQVIVAEKQADGKYLLRYQVQKATALKLAPDTTLTFDDKGIGSHLVEPKETTTYTFIAEGSGNSISSDFVLEVTPPEK
jgi:hypothetical protein